MSQLADVSGQPALAGLKDALFGLGEAGEIEPLSKLIQRALGLGKAGLQLPGRGSQRRDHRLAWLGSAIARVPQEALASGWIRGHPPGREEGLGFSGAQSMAHDGFGQTLLLCPGTSGQGAGDGYG